MPKPHRPAGARRESLARELLDFYDELTAVNASTAFVLNALAAAAEAEAPPSGRSATGALFCIRWLNGRALDLERRLRDIRALANRPRKFRDHRAPTKKAW